MFDHEECKKCEKHSCIGESYHIKWGTQFVFRILFTKRHHSTISIYLFRLSNCESDIPGRRMFLCADETEDHDTSIGTHPSITRNRRDRHSHYLLRAILPCHRCQFIAQTQCKGSAEYRVDDPDCRVRCI